VFACPIALRYPCRCLCLGSLLQITMTTRSRRITLQCSQRGFTDARTFTKNSSIYLHQDPY